MNLKAILLLLLSMTMVKANALELTGQLTQGGMVRGKTEPGDSVELNGKPVKVSADGQFVIGFGRDAQLENVLTVQTKDGVMRSETITLSQRQYNIQRVNGIAQTIMQPSAENIARAQKDAEMVYLARMINSDRQAFLCDFIWPLQGRLPAFMAVSESITVSLADLTSASISPPLRAQKWWRRRAVL